MFGLHRIKRTPTEKGGITVEVAVYAPRGQKGQEELRRRVALAHARGVMTAVVGFSCPEDQKMELIGRVRSLCRNLGRECARERNGE